MTVLIYQAEEMHFGGLSLAFHHLHSKSGTKEEAVNGKE